MAVNKRKAIIALIPFIITTIGVIIFIVFFNYGTVTFTGASPFSVAVDGDTNTDLNGIVQLRLAATDHTFKVQKQGYFEQEINESLAWNESKNITLDFMFEPIAVSSKFTPAITYNTVANIQDNQKRDLLFAESNRPNTILPANYTRIVWAQDGKSACLFNPTNATVEPKLWQSNGAILSLPTNTFDCFSAPTKIISAQLNNQNLLFNAKLIKSNVKLKATVSMSPDGAYAVLNESDENSTESLVSIINTETNEILELGRFTLQEQPRFLSNSSLGLHVNTHIIVYAAPFKEQKIMDINTSIVLVAHSAATQTYYSLEKREPNGLPSLSDFMSGTSSTGYSLISYKKGQERTLATFPPEQSFSFMTTNAAGTKLKVISDNTLDLITYTLTP